MHSRQRMMMALAALAVCAFPTPAFAAPPQPAIDARNMGAFSCTDGKQIRAMFNADSSAAAIVQAADGRQHQLAIQEPVMTDPQVRWSDGVHTLIWRAGVTLNWQDGTAAPVSCLRGSGGHHH